MGTVSDSAGDLGMRRYYAARAPIYDEIYTLPERQADLRWLEQFVPRQFSGRHVLDIAAGTGYWTEFIVAEAREVLAIDTSDETLEILQARITSERISTAVHSAYELASLGAFDAAFAGFWFSHVPRARRRAFFNGLDTVLRPGSTVILIDNQYDSVRHAVQGVDEAGDGWQERTLPDGSQHRVLKNFPRPDEMLESLEGIASRPVWRELEHFWLFQYTTGGCRT